MATTTTRRSLKGLGGWDRIEYRVLVGISFTICLVAAAVRRAVRPGQHAKSVIAEARADAYAAVGYAFIR